MKPTFFSKIFIGYFVIILMLSAASLLAFSHTSKGLYRETIAGSLKDAAVILGGEAGRALSRKDVPAFQSHARQTAQELNMRITLIDAAGVVLADSHEDPASMENHRNRPEFVEALSGRTGISSRFGSTRSQEALYVAVPVEYQGAITGAVRKHDAEGRWPPPYTYRPHDRDSRPALAARAPCRFSYRKKRVAADQAAHGRRVQARIG